MDPGEERAQDELEQLRAENIRLRERLAQLERHADVGVLRMCMLEQERDRARTALLGRVEPPA